MMIMVAGNEHHLGLRAERGAEVPQRGLGRSERISHRPVPKLDHVTEQHQPVNSRQRFQQGLPRNSTAKQIDATARAEVQVRDDQRPQRS